MHNLQVWSPPESPAEGSMLAITAAPHRVPLHEDEDTSMVESLALHLMSEHQQWAALQLDEQEAVDLHVALHADQVCDHPVDDLRFRPGIALAGMLRRIEQHELLQRVLMAIAEDGPTPKMLT